MRVWLQVELIRVLLGYLLHVVAVALVIVDPISCRRAPQLRWHRRNRRGGGCGRGDSGVGFRGHSRSGPSQKQGQVLQHGRASQ